MATTYTQSLRLWEGQPGDPAIRNSWGLDLNTNFTLIEASILGTSVVSIAGQTSYSLTTANGAADQAREYIQSFTGAITANCTVTLPNVPKIGWAQNVTSGGKNVILTTGAGVSLAIPPDATFYWYRVDGAGNVTSPTFTYSSLNIATLSVSGNLSVGGALTVAGPANLNGGATMPNNVFFAAKDTGGAAHPILFYGTDNFTHVAAGTAGHFQVQATGLNATYLDVSATGLSIPNNAYYSGNDTSGTPRHMLVYGGDNNTYIVAGTGGAFNVINASQSTVLFTVPASGGATLNGNQVVTSNGGTWNISIAGNANSANTAGFASTANTANFATTAGTANAVAWNNVSGKPAICYNDGNTYSINITGAAAFAAAAGAVAWGNVSGKPYAFNQNTDVGSSVSFGTIQLTTGNAGSAGGYALQPTSVGPFSGSTNVALTASGLDIQAQRFIAASDGRLKRNRKRITAKMAWDVIRAAPGYLYEKRDGNGGFSFEVGIIAQDLLDVLPHILFQSPDPSMPADRYGYAGPAGIRYDLQNNAMQVIGLVAAGDLEKRVRRMEKDIADLQRRLKAAGL